MQVPRPDFMPLQKENCGECGRSDLVCPACGSRFVTPRDNPQHPSPNELVNRGGQDSIEYTHVCWDCGWKEYVTVTIERETE